MTTYEKRLTAVEHGLKVFRAETITAYRFDTLEGKFDQVLLLVTAMAKKIGE